MDNESQTPHGDTQLPIKAVCPPAWQLNDLQRAFIEELWQPEVYDDETPGSVDMLAVSDSPAVQR
ncbi:MULTISPECIES: hypothetical protein [unclassified Serratia (in: enterobacteria)]|uniref:hypothetical protein n=1 Tax=unclassified Serratia (in: enterobacteria) TaxID=2647522 RepID=UPI00307622B8